MQFPWVVNCMFAAEPLAAPAKPESRASIALGCYDDPNSIFHVAELEIEPTLIAIIVMTIIHFFRIAQQPQIAVTRSADSLGHAPIRTRSRYSRRRS